MFEKGEYVVYGTSGVCKIAEITTLDMESVSRDRLYYVLEPVTVKGSRIFTPVDSTKMQMRRIMTKAEAEALIDNSRNIGLLSWTDDKQREEEYKEALRSGDCREWIRVIRTIWLRRQARILDGKKLTAMDEKYLKQAEENLYSEMAIPLEMKSGDMERFITEHVISIDAKS